MKLLSIAALAPAFILTGAYAQEDAKPAAEAPEPCFNFTDVKTFKSLDADTIRIETNDAKKYDLDLTGPKCGPLDSAGDLSIKTAPVFKLCSGILGRGRIAFQSAADAEPLACTISKIGIAPSESAKSK